MFGNSKIASKIGYYNCLTVNMKGLGPVISLSKKFDQQSLVLDLKKELFWIEYWVCRILYL